MMKLRLIFVFVGLLITAVPINAQRLCEALVEKALDKAEESCAGLEDDKACYGYDALTPTFYEDVEDNTLTFEGSSVDLSPLHIVQGTGLDAEEDEWGIGFIQIAADSSVNEAGGQFRILLLGDVTVENIVTPDDDDLDAFDVIHMSAGDESECQEAVNDMLIQSPQGVTGQIIVNEVPIEFGSTVVLGWGVDEGNEVMYVTVLDGEAYIDRGTPQEQIIGMREASAVVASEEEPVVDPQTGYAVLDKNGNPMMRRYVEPQFYNTQSLSADEDGFWNLEYYRSFENIPEGLLYYPIDLEAEEEPCECELDIEAQCSIGNPDDQVNITITNSSDVAVGVSYIQQDCAQFYEGILIPGNSAEAWSFVGEEWVFLQDGEVVKEFTVTGAGTYSYP